MNDSSKKKNLLIILLTAGLVAAAGFLASSIVQRKYETKLLQSPTANIPTNESRNSKWGDAYPYQWNSYMAGAKSVSSAKTVDELDHNPKLVALWAGYGFAKDYNRPRTHVFAVVDTINSLRTGAPKDKKSGPMPATCMTCKSPDVPRLMEEKGVKEFYEGKWARHVEDVVNPIGCADCHDSKTMALRISRPALVEALERQGTELSEVSHQDMRSLVCAQCHVEYYFQKPGTYLTFPWDKGMNMEAYYDASGFKDWTHGVSKAPMLKAQHPDYEVYKHGIHAKRDVACADCHMPFKTEGGVKFSDHHVRSPLENVANACQQCHRVSEEEIKQNVADLKYKYLDLKETAEVELVTAHFEAKKAWELGATEAEMQESLDLIRKAQWRWDYATAGHGSYFHAPEETLRVLGASLHKAGQARLALQKILIGKGFNGEVALPDLKSKDAMMSAVGLDFEVMKKEKVAFIDDLVRKWWKSSPVADDKMMPKAEDQLRK